MTRRDQKDVLYGAFAQVTQALSGPRRLELLDLLVQGPRSVDALAQGLGQPVPNVSQHLQVLRRAHLVHTTRHGRSIEYRLAPGVAEVFAALRQLAQGRSPAVQVARNQLFADAPQRIDREGLQDHLDAGSAVLLDVRPALEYAAGHLPGAVSIPHDQLAERVHEVPAAELVVATCRGPYCAFAADAAQLLRERGRPAVWFDDGVAEWRAAGGSVVVEAAS